MFPRNPLPHRHLARRPRRPRAAHRRGRARLGRGGAQRPLGRLAPQLQRRLRREVAQRPARRHRLLRGAARPPARLPLARSLRLEILPARDAAPPRSTSRSASATARRPPSSSPRPTAPPSIPGPATSTSRSPAPCSIAVAGTTQIAGTAYTVDHATGLVTFLAGHIPASGAAITAGFEFDVPVRFDTDKLEINIQGVRHGAIPSIPIVEIRV